MNTSNLNNKSSEPKQLWLKNYFKHSFAINDEYSEKLMGKIKEIQFDCFKKADAHLIFPSTEFPYRMLVTKNSFHVLKEEVGSGSYCTVNRVHVVALKGNVFRPGQEKIMALKCSKQSTRGYHDLLPEFNALKSAVSFDVNGIDHFIKFYKEKNGRTYTLHELYDYTLNQVPYEKLANPIFSTFKMIQTSMKGLSALHKKGYVHRDIKGGNLLVSTKGNVTGAITDFGLLQKEKGQQHSTCGTPTYLDPSMFGSPEESLIQQKKRKGRQTKEGDIFALGRTIEKDILMNLLLKIGKKRSVDLSSDIGQLEPKRISGPFSEKALKQFGKTYPNRVIYVHKGNKPHERIFIYKTEKDRRQILTEAAKKVFDNREIEHIECLFDLAFEMQGTNRPNIDQILGKIDDTLKDLRHSDLTEKSHESADQSSDDANHTTQPTQVMNASEASTIKMNPVENTLPTEPLHSSSEPQNFGISTIAAEFQTKHVGAGKRCFVQGRGPYSKRRKLIPSR